MHTITSLSLSPYIPPSVSPSLSRKDLEMMFHMSIMEEIEYLKSNITSIGLMSFTKRVCNLLEKIENKRHSDAINYAELNSRIVQLEITAKPNDTNVRIGTSSNRVWVNTDSGTSASNPIITTSGSSAKNPNNP
jgi:hypothetical protein